MGRQASKSVEIYMNEHDLTGRTNLIELAVDVNTPDVTCFGDSAEEYVEGLMGGKVTQNGFFDGDDDGVDEQMFDEIGAGSAALLCIVPAGTGTKGNVVYELQAICDEQPRKAAVAGAILLEASWTITTGIVRGSLMMKENVAASGVVSGTAMNIGVTASGTTLVAVLRVISVTGSGSITVRVEESSDNGAGDAYATLFTFTAKTAVGSQRMTIATASEAWKRINVTAMSGFTAATIMVTVGTLQGT